MSSHFAVVGALACQSRYMIQFAIGSTLISRAFALEELEHVEVAVAFGGLREELAGHLHQRLDPQAIDFDLRRGARARRERVVRLLAPEVVVDLARRVRRRLGDPIREDPLRQPGRRALLDAEHAAIAERRPRAAPSLREDAVRLACCRFVRTDLAAHVVHHVAEIDRVERAESEVDRELEPRLARRGIDAIVLLEEQDAEAVETGVLHAQPIFRFVHAEAARSARASREEHVVVDDFLSGEPFRFEALKVFDQGARP